MDNSEKLVTLGTRQRTTTKNTLGNTENYKRLATRTTQEKTAMNPLHTKCKQFLLLIRHPSCKLYSSVLINTYLNINSLNNIVFLKSN